MATPTLTLINYTDIADAEVITSWTTWSTLDTDLYKEGSNSITGTFRNDLQTGYYDDATARTCADRHFRAWFNFTAVAFLDTEANNGMEFYMYDGTTTEYVVAFGSDTYQGGWKNYVVSGNLFTTLTAANVQRWGCRFNNTANPANKNNFWADHFKYLDGYSFTGGASGTGNGVSLGDLTIADAGTTTKYGYGILQETEGVYICYGELQIGDGATTTYFEMEGNVLVFSDQDVASDLYTLRGDGAGCTITINNSTIQSAGSADNTRFTIDMDETNLASFTFTNNVVQRAGASTFKSGQTVTGNTFNNCGQITHGGADMDDCNVNGYEGTVDTGALVYDVAVDPDGEMDNMSFTKGTAATHAITFGTTSPLTMTLRGVDFSGYNALDAQTDSTLYIARTTGTVTINLIGCTGNITYKSAGATVSLVQSVTLTVTGLITLSDVVIYDAGTTTVLDSVDQNVGTSWAYAYEASDAGDYVDIGVFLAGYRPYYVRTYQLGATSTSVPVAQTLDRDYLE